MKNKRKYHIKVIRSYVGNFSFDLIGSAKGRVIAESKMYTSKDMCMKIAKRLKQDLNCTLEFIDMEKDYEE